MITIPPWPDWNFILKKFQTEEFVFGQIHSHGWPRSVRGFPLSLSIGAYRRCFPVCGLEWIGFTSNPAGAWSADTLLSSISGLRLASQAHPQVSLPDVRANCLMEDIGSPHWDCVVAHQIDLKFKSYRGGRSVPLTTSINCL